MDESKNNVVEEQEIDLLEIAAKLWRSRRTILKWCGFGAIAGLIVAFSIPKEYTTTIKIAPESDKATSSNISSFAAMAGISMGSTAVDAVAPSLYPDVLGSVPFTVGLFDVKVKEKGGDSIYTVREYLNEHTSSPWWSVVLGLPGRLIGLFSSSSEQEAVDSIDTFNLSQKDAVTSKALAARIRCDYDLKSSVNTITVTMQDPLVSAMLADTVAEHLKAFITEYRTSKARQDLEYAIRINDEARDAYYAAQQRYADYLDRNHSLSLHSAQVTRDRLHNETTLAFNLFNQTQQQLSLARAKVQETKPIFAFLEPATVPAKPSKPSKILILIAFIFLAGVAAGAKVIFAENIKIFRDKLNEQ